MFKKYIYKSALLDLQRGNNYILGMTIIYWIVQIIDISFILSMVFAIICGVFSHKYHKLGLRLYYYHICERNGKQPESMNITFKVK